MKLTKEKAIEEHRKMWNWIADQLENGVTEEIWTLKKRYCKENELSLMHDCFCCEYNDNFRKCDDCPLLWGAEEYQDTTFCVPEYDDNGVSWWKANSHSMNEEYAEAAKISRQIANLPEKPDNYNKKEE